MFEKRLVRRGFINPKNVSEQYRVVSFRHYDSASELMIDIAKWWATIEKKDDRLLVQSMAFSAFPDPFTGKRKHGADVVCLYQLENWLYDPDPDNDRSILLEDGK